MHPMTWLLLFAAADPLTHDFGSTPQGILVQREFSWTNPHAVPVRVQDIITSCRCVRLDMLRPVAQPQQPIRIRTRIATDGIIGTKEATATLVFVESVPSVTFRLQVRVQPQLSVQPGQLDFGIVRQQSAKELSVTVTRQMDADWRLTQIQVPLPWSAVLHEPTTTPAGVAQQVTVRLPAQSAPGRHAGMLQLHSNDSAADPIGIPLSAEVSDLTIQPPRLQVPLAKVGASTTQQLFLHGAEPFIITGLTSSDPAWTVTVKRQQGTIAVLEATFHPASSGLHRAEIHATTSLGAIAIEASARVE